MKRGKIEMGKKRYLFLACAVLAFCATLGFLAVPVSHAGEGFNNHYLGGNEDFMMGALPPAGTSVFLNYMFDYNVNTLKDNAGRDATIGAASANKAKLSLNVLGDALRFVQVTKLKVLGGDLTWHVIVPVAYIHQSLTAFGAYAPGSPDSKTGLGDVEAGVGIAWHCPTFHQGFFLDFVAPTGAYSGSGTSNRNFVPDGANVGRNYWSINPLYVFTYIGDKSSPLPGLELSGKVQYFINTVNSDTGYVSGQEFDVDYLVGYHINKDWSLGANGFFLYQTTNDKQFGHTAVDPLTGLATGILGKELSVGPALSYNLPKGCLTFKWQHDVWADNRPEGDKFWIRFVWAF